MQLNVRFVAVATILAMVAVGLAPGLTIADDSRGSRAIAEVEAKPGCPNNDNWNCAQEIFTVTGSGDAASGQEWVAGQTSLNQSNRNDYFKFKGVKAGMVINASVRLMSSGFFEDQVLTIELFNPSHEAKIAWSESGHVWEALTAVAVLENIGDVASGTFNDYWYLRLYPLKDDSRIITYVLNVRAAFPQEIDLTTLDDQPMEFFDIDDIALSNQTDTPGQWFRLKMAAGQTVNDVANVTISGWDPDTEGQFDIYLRDLRANSWANWYNVSWWGEVWPTGGSLNPEEADMAASHSYSLTDGTLYYADVQAWNGSANVDVHFARKTIASDGDNTLETATQIVRTPGMTKYIAEGSMHWSYAHQDWYKFDLNADEAMTATIFLRNQSTSIFRVSLHTINHTSGDDRINLVYSDSNIDPGGVAGFASASVVQSDADTYYIRVMAQVPLMPSNVSNLADWHMNNAVADYTLEVDLPDRDGAPTLTGAASSLFFMDEDTVDTSIDLDTWFADEDIGDAELDDALTYSLTNTPLHVGTEIDPDTAVLSLMPETDWNGQDYVVLRATDRYGKFAEINVSVVVENVNDAPRVQPGAVDLLRPFHVRHGEVNSTFAAVPVPSIFTDPDIALTGDSLTYSVSSATADADVRARISATATLEYDTAVVMSNAAGPFVVPLTLTATDEETASTDFSVDVTVWPDEGTVLALTPAKSLTLKEGEGGEVLIELDDYFAQSRGKALKYAVEEQGSPNLTVVFNDNATALVGSKGDFTTGIGVGLTLRAWTDSPFSEATNTILVFVTDVPDAPRIVETVPDLTLVPEIVVAEGIGEELFQITVEDVDTPSTNLRYFWFVDLVLVSQLGRNWVYEPDYDAAGAHTVCAKVQDTTALTAEHCWPVSVTNTNRKPTVTIVTPLNNSQQDPKGKTVKFIAEAVDPDGGPLTFTWSEGGVDLKPPATAEGTNGTPATNTVELSFKRGSSHQVDLLVTDSEGERVRRSVSISIKASAVGTPGFEAVGMLAAMATAGTLVVLGRRKRQDE